MLATQFCTMLFPVSDEVYSWGSGCRGELGKYASENVFQAQLVTFF